MQLNATQDPMISNASIVGSITLPTGQHTFGLVMQDINRIQVKMCPSKRHRSIALPPLLRRILVNASLGTAKDEGHVAPLSPGRGSHFCWNSACFIGPKLEELRPPGTLS